MYRPRCIPLQFPRYTDAKDIRREIDEIRQRIESNTMMNMDIQQNVTAEIDQLRQENMDLAAILDRKETMYGHTNIYEEVTRLRCMNLRLKATMDLREMNTISRTYKRPRVGARTSQTIYDGPIKQKNSRLSNGHSTHKEPDNSRWLIDDTPSIDRDSNMNSIRDSPSESERIGHPMRSPSGSIVSYDLHEDVTAVDSCGCPDKSSSRAHMESSQLLYEEDIPHYRTITVEDVEIRDIYSSRSSNVSNVNPVEEHDSLSNVTDIPSDEDSHRVIPFKLAPSSNQQRPDGVSKLDLRGMVSDSDIDIPQVNQDTEPDLVAIVEAQRYVDYIDSCEATLHLCSAITEMCDDRTGGHGQDVLIPKQVITCRNEPMESSSLEETDGNSDVVVWNRHFKVVSSAQRRPTCVPKLDLTGLASESDINLARIGGHSMPWLFLDHNLSNNASDMSPKRSSDLKNSLTKPNSVDKKGKGRLTSSNKRNIKQDRVHLKDVDSTKSDHYLHDEDDVPCIYLSQEPLTIRPVKEGHVVKEFLRSDDESPMDAVLDYTTELPYAGLGNDEGPKLIESEFVDDDVGSLNLNMSTNAISNHWHQASKNNYTEKIYFQDRTQYYTYRDPGDVDTKSRY